MRNAIAFVIALSLLNIAAPAAWATDISEADVKKICGSQYGGGGGGNYGCSKCSTSSGTCADYNCKDGKCTVTPVTRDSAAPSTPGPKKTGVAPIGVKDLTTKPLDKSSPTLSTSDVRNQCSKNPSCRVVRDDAQLTAFCTGENCVVARKAGKGQQEYLNVTMSDVLVGKVSGPPVKTSQGIIAILVGQVAPPSAAGSPAGDLLKAKSTVAPPAGLLDDRSPAVASPRSPGSARSKALREDVKPTTSGPGGPMLK
jgi:hypothetical protein